MRRPFIAGNWKMNLDRRGSIALARAVAEGARACESVDLAVCPPSIYLDAVSQVLIEAAHGTRLGLGAQNVYFESAGAFTGELSAAMLVDVGCQWVILGHSERRHILGETNEEVRRKVLAALASDLGPIVCVGETLPQRQSGRTREVIREQFEGSLQGLSPEQMTQVVVAYEPVWAIGTGQVATPEQAEEVHADLRSLLESRYNSEVAEAVRIQYGGSVKPENAAELLRQPNIDGALVGGASLKAADFLAIAAAAST